MALSFQARRDSLVFSQTTFSDPVDGLLGVAYPPLMGRSVLIAIPSSPRRLPIHYPIMTFQPQPQLSIR